MKKILSFVLAALMLVSVVPMVYAADVDVSEGTTIKVVGKGSDTYTATVPAKLAPGESGTVSVSGTWASNQTVNITAPASVDLTYKGQTLNVPITFSGISKAGSDTEAVTASGTLTVGNATALFGTWTGTVNYTVEMVEDSTGGDSGTTEPSDPDTGDDGEEATLITFTINGISYQAEEGWTWEQWVNSEHNTVGADTFDVGGGQVIVRIPNEKTIYDSNLYGVLPNEVIVNNGVYGDYDYID